MVSVPVIIQERIRNVHVLIIENMILVIVEAGGLTLMVRELFAKQ